MDDYEFLLNLSMQLEYPPVVQYPAMQYPQTLPTCQEEWRTRITSGGSDVPSEDSAIGQWSPAPANSSVVGFGSVADHQIENGADGVEGNAWVAEEKEIASLRQELDTWIDCAQNIRHQKAIVDRETLLKLLLRSTRMLAVADRHREAVHNMVLQRAAKQRERAAADALAAVRGRSPTSGSDYEGMRPLCVFCRNNQEPYEMYISHKVKDASGKVLCPVLRQYTCPLCGANGDNAHTIKYCPLSTGAMQAASASACLRTPRNAAGHFRKK